MSAYAVVDMFERKIAEYCGSKYAVAMDSCCNAIKLCLVYKKAKYVSLPRFTYPGVICSIIHAGAKIEFSPFINWQGQYTLAPHDIIDSALRFRQGMYIPRKLMCLSFHAKKHLPIGRGGMVLTDDQKAYEWLKRARFDGRNEVPLIQDDIQIVGWNCYMTPEQAARGLMLLDLIKSVKLPDLEMQKQGYPDCSKIWAYNEHLVNPLKLAEYKGYRNFRDKEWLRKKYLEENLQLEDIAKMCGVKRSTIASTIRIFDIRKRRFSERKSSHSVGGRRGNGKVG